MFWFYVTKLRSVPPPIRGGVWLSSALSSIDLEPNGQLSGFLTCNLCIAPDFF